MTDRVLFEKALKALEYAAERIGCPDDDDAIGVARKALRERLAQPEQEPVAWSWEHDGRVVNAFPFKPDSESEYWKDKGWKTRPLVYGDTAPPRREWVGLTPDEKKGLNDALNLQGRFPVIDAIEAKLREKNT